MIHYSAHIKQIVFLLSFMVVLLPYMSEADPVRIGSIQVKQLIYDAATEQHIDPYLLFAVAIAESQKKINDHSFTAWPWTLNVAGKAYYFDTKKEAVDFISTSIQDGVKPVKIDVGMFQINLFYVKGMRTANPIISLISDETLIEIENNSQVAALFLAEAIQSAPGDLSLGVGHYHSHRPLIAIKYGRKVVSIAKKLKILKFFGGAKWKQEHTEIKRSQENGYQRHRAYRKQTPHEPRNFLG